jgi:hypothetical protein
MRIFWREREIVWKARREESESEVEAGSVEMQIAAIAI